MLYPIIKLDKLLYYLKLLNLTTLLFFDFLDGYLVVWVKKIIGITFCKLATLDTLLIFFNIYDLAFNS